MLHSYSATSEPGMSEVSYLDQGDKELDFCSKSSLKMKVKFSFYFEIEIQESGERVERQGIHTDWKSV